MHSNAAANERHSRTDIQHYDIGHFYGHNRNQEFFYQEITLYSDAMV